MFYKILESLDKRFGTEEASAHCDIPCGIYDPITAQIAALTVVRMIDLMNDLDGSGIAYTNSMSRYITVKEEHAEKTKHEIRIIWGDYLKEQHFTNHPNAQDLVHKIMMLGSKTRQGVDRESAVQLVEAVNDFAEIFWATKGVATKRAKAPYAPALEMVYPDL